jgi:hypothetical protein
MTSDFSLNNTLEPKTNHRLKTRKYNKNVHSHSMIKIDNNDSFENSLPDRISRMYNFVFMQRWPETKKFDSR